MSKRETPRCFRTSAAILLFAAAGAASAAQDNWERVGPFLPGGVVTAFAIDPSSPDTLYAATETGVFKTIDGGTHWFYSSSGLPNAFVQSIVLDSQSPSNIYVVSWLNGVYRSADGGLSWEPTSIDGTLANQGVPSLVIGPEGVLRAAVGGAGIFRSDDHAKTWTSENDGLDSLYVFSIGVASSSPSVVYASSDTGSFRKSSASTPWTRTSSLTVSGLAVDSQEPDVVYGISSLGVSKSIDRGKSWSAKNAGLPTIAYPQQVVVDPVSSTTLYLVDYDQVFKSTDGGESWADHTAGIAVLDQCASTIAAVPQGQTLYLGNACLGGVYKSLDGAASWSRTGDAFATPTVSALLADPSSGALFAATGQGLFRTTSGGASWTGLNDGLESLNALALAQAPSAPATLYAETYSPENLSGTLYRTIDGGQTWSPTPLVAPGYPALLAVDPGSPATVYVAQYTALTKSTDGGRSGGSVHDFGATITMLAFQGATLYVGTGEGELWASGDGGAGWRLIHAFEVTDGISSIAVDPVTPETLYVGWVFSGVLAPYSYSYGGVYKSSDGGSSWEEAQEGFGVTSLVLDPRSASVVYAASLAGVLVSEDAGESWTLLGNGLPFGSNIALAINPRDPSTLYAGMSGLESSSVFRLRLEERPIRPVPGAARAPRVVTRPD